MNMLRNFKIFGLAALISLSFAPQLAAQTAEQFYQGKTVTVVVSAAAGTASDTVGRLFVTYLEKHFPGKPNFVVVNKPGAGGLKAASELMLKEAKDGTVIALLQRNNFYIPLLTKKEDQFDPRKVRWVGSINGEEYPNTILAYKHSPVQNAQDIFKKKMVIGATSYTHENRTIPAMLNKYVGAKFDVVPGYKGRGGVYLAMERGEVDGWMQGFNTLRTSKGGGKYVENGLAKPIIVIGTERHPDWPDLPAITEFVTDESQRSVIDFFLAPLRGGRPFAVPGTVPEDRIVAIRGAFDSTFQDAEAMTALKKRLQSKVTLIKGEEIENLIKGIYAAPQATIDGARDILKKKK